MINLNQSTMLADASALNQTANMNNNYISINHGAGGPNYSQSGNKLLEQSMQQYPQQNRAS